MMPDDILKEIDNLASSDEYCEAFAIPTNHALSNIKAWIKDIADIPKHHIVTTAGCGDIRIRWIKNRKEMTVVSAPLESDSYVYAEEIKDFGTISTSANCVDSGLLIRFFEWLNETD